MTLKQLWIINKEDKDMKRSLSSMNTNQLRELAVELGFDRKKLYGTSKQALIIMISRAERNANRMAEAIRNNTY